MKYDLIPRGDISNKSEDDLFYNAGSFNIPGLMFQPAAPNKGAKQFEPAEVFQNVYFVGDNSVGTIVFKTDEGILIWDSLEGPKSMTDILEPDFKKLGLNPSDIKVCLVSHGHYDHFGGAGYLQKHYGTKVYMNELDIPTMKFHTDMQGPEWFGEDGVPTLDGYLEDGQVFKFGQFELTLMHTPGHSVGSMSFFVPVSAFDGTPHILCCWGGTSAPRDKENAAIYLQSLDRFRTYIEEHQVDSFLSVHPFVDYSTAKCQKAKETHDSSPLIRTAEEMSFFCRALEVYTKNKPENVMNGILYPFVERDEFIRRFANDSYGFGQDVLSTPHVIYMAEEGNGNGSYYLKQILRARIFDDVYYVGTGSDACIIYDTTDGIVITDAMNDAEDFNKIVRPAMLAFGLDPKRITAVMLTSGRSDKIGFAAFVQKTFGAKVCMNLKDTSLVPNLQIDDALVTGDRSFGKFTFRWMETPGTTAGCMSYVVNVTLDGKDHTLACWGSTVFNYDRELLSAFCKSVNAFKTLCAETRADSLVSSHPYFNYGAEKVLNLQAGRQDAFVLNQLNSVDFALSVIGITAHFKLAQQEIN